MGENVILQQMENKPPNINHCIELIDNIHDTTEKGENFNLLLEKADIPTLVNEVYKKYNGKYDKIVELIEKSKLNSITTKKVKVIGMYYPRLTNGGIERVMEHLTKLYVSMGYRVVLITDTPSEQDYVNLPENATRYDLKRGSSYKDRAENIQKIVKKEKIDTMIYHSWLSNILVVEMLLYKSLGVSFVIYTHGVFSYLLIEPSNYFNYMPRIYSVADAIACLGEVNASYWKNCNSNVSTVQNPPTFDIKSSKVSKLENNTILWVGRISPEKKPYEALLILAEVCKEVANVKLKIVGKPHNEKELDLLKDLSKKLGVEKNVEFCGFHEDVSSFFLESSILLSTSKCEGFPLALFEGKTFGVPIVLYELPYLTLSENNRGMLPVKFGDHKNASNEIIKLFKDRELLRNLGQESRNHALELAEYDYQSTWDGVFSSLFNERIDIDLNKPEIVMFNTLLHHNSFQQIDKDNLNKLNNIQKITPKIDTSNYENEFPVVFISEEKNVKSLAVALTSLLENKGTSKYQINILHEDKYTNGNINLIKKIEKKYKCSLNFNKLDKPYKLNPKDISKTISNTLKIDKCIYLSYDVVVQKDLIELYNINLENCSIGAVKEGNGFNSNVLLIDTKINNDDIKSIELEYNLNSEYFDNEPSFNFNKQVKLKAELIENFSNKELKSALKENVIFSYQNDVNPFNNSNCSFDYVWMTYFRLSPFNKIKRKTCKKPKISVIIPVYNVEQYLMECLDSVINQTLEDIEIICIDDGSPDNSLNILKEYAEFDKRVILLEQENQGAGSARNNGINNAKGEFVIFMDPDDYYPNLYTLEHLYNSAIDNDVLIAGGSFSTVVDGVVLPNQPNNKHVFNENKLTNYIDYQFEYGYTKFIFNRKMLAENDINFPNYLRYEDPVFFVKAMIQAERFYANNEVVYRYRFAHKEENWTNEKIYDNVCGMYDVIKISKENNLNQLHKMAIHRVKETKDIWKKGNQSVFDKIKEVSGFVDPVILNSIGVDFDDLLNIDGLLNTKIGIITHYHHSLNIGGNLQAYALTKFLNNIEINCAKQISLNMNHYNYQFFRKKQENLKSFNESIPHTEKVYYENQSLENINDDFDIIITGSDQVWSPVWFNQQFFLPGIKKRKISYAASIGVDSLNTKQIKIMDLIKKIDYISVREKTAENLIKQHLDNKITTVVDPVLLLDRKHWDELSIKPNIKEKYAFAHFLGNGFEGRQLAIDSAKIQKLSLAHIPYLFCRYNNFDDKWGNIKDVDAGPREFLGLILDSDFVYTDSFHCVVFAIIFRKKFIVVERVDNNAQTMFSRISDFLSVLGLMDRIVLSSEDITDDLLNKDIDYDKVYKKLNKFKNHSLEFLIKAFENTSLEDKLRKISF